MSPYQLEMAIGSSRPVSSRRGLQFKRVSVDMPAQDAVLSGSSYLHKPNNMIRHNSLKSVSKDDEVNGSTALGIETVSHVQGIDGVFVIIVVDQGVGRI
ncbi:hypothetical protein F2Q69_00044300 [Brassica cretica]|uniref:Uncharacterized protein n=1 Tax=Brassica cretica TaxID=69181 RepID=A0A8S9NEX0_BRACR|nr:hypothetical protein F2Q69_00044300 [Brassica cretica]